MFLNLIEPTITELENELLNVDDSLKQTTELVNFYDNLSEEKIQELENLSENLELIKNFERLDKKKKHVDWLSNRKNIIESTIKQMKNLNLDKYDQDKITHETE